MSDAPNAHASGHFKIGGDLDVHRLGFGAMRITGEGVWGEPADVEHAKQVLRRALELGVTLIDTADSYGPEVSERLIGETLHPYPDGLVIATKAGLTRSAPGRWDRDGHPDRIRGCCEASLKRLKLDQIDLYQFHAPDPEVPLEESLGAFKELKDEGKVRHVGVCNFGVEELARGQKVIPEIVSVQNRYNLADREHEDVLDACAEQGDRLHPVVSARDRRAHQARRRAARARRLRARRNPVAGRARVAAAALAGDAADPGHGLGRAPRGKHRGCRARIVSRRVRAARSRRDLGKPKIVR